MWPLRCCNYTCLCISIRGFNDLRQCIAHAHMDTSIADLTEVAYSVPVCHLDICWFTPIWVLKEEFLIGLKKPSSSVFATFRLFCWVERWIDATVRHDQEDPLMRSFDIFFIVSLNKLSNKFRVVGDLWCLNAFVLQDHWRSWRERNSYHFGWAVFKWMFLKVIFVCRCWLHRSSFQRI